MHLLYGIIASQDREWASLLFGDLLGMPSYSRRPLTSETLRGEGQIYLTRSGGVAVVSSSASDSPLNERDGKYFGLALGVADLAELETRLEDCDGITKISDPKPGFLGKSMLYRYGQHLVFEFVETACEISTAHSDVLRLEAVANVVDDIGDVLPSLDQIFERSADEAADFPMLGSRCVLYYVGDHYVEFNELTTREGPMARRSGELGGGDQVLHLQLEPVKFAKTMAALQNSPLVTVDKLMPLRAVDNRFGDVPVGTILSIYPRVLPALRLAILEPYWPWQYRSNFERSGCAEERHPETREVGSADGK